MWAQIAALAGKDIRLFLTRGHGLVQALLLGLLLIFLFSLAASGEQQISGAWAAAIFWMASCFCQILVFNALYALEDVHKAREALLMAPMPAQAIWAGKAVAGGVILLVMQGVFLPACIVFLNLTSVPSWTWLLGSIVLVDAGLILLGALLGGMGAEQSGRDSLFTVILFPLFVPLLLTGIRLGEFVIEGIGMENPWAWIRLGASFDLVFGGLALLLFPFVYKD
jgi:heme exporter protein B